MINSSFMHLAIVLYFIYKFALAGDLEEATAATQPLNKAYIHVIPRKSLYIYKDEA